jgi:hypothetical protein
VRTYATVAPYEAPASAQIRTSNTTNQHVTALQNRQTRNSDKSQADTSLVVVVDQTGTVTITRGADSSGRQGCG